MNGGIARLAQAADTETIENQDVQANWREVLDWVRRGETRVPAAKDGAPVVAVFLATDFARFRRCVAERQEGVRSLERGRAAFADVPEGELEREVARALSDARAKHRRRVAQQPTSTP
jgi:hypothetical protein